VSEELLEGYRFGLSEAFYYTTDSFDESNWVDWLWSIDKKRKLPPNSAKLMQLAAKTRAELIKSIGEKELRKMESKMRRPYRRNEVGLPRQYKRSS
jgi:hypothetical protein